MHKVMYIVLFISPMYIVDVVCYNIVEEEWVIIQWQPLKRKNNTIYNMQKKN